MVFVSISVSRTRRSCTSVVRIPFLHRSLVARTSLRHIHHIRHTPLVVGRNLVGRVATCRLVDDDRRRGEGEMVCNPL